MAYDERLAERIRRAMGIHPDITEKRMFGGSAFLKQGKMFCGVVKGELMVRVVITGARQ
jgi:TfoX/Sxy family transcriptional regulator of competence genes